MQLYFYTNKFTETCDHRPKMVSNRTVIPSNSDDWLFAKLSYPCDASRKFGAEQDYLISIVKQDGEKIDITVNCNTDCTCQHNTKISGQNPFFVKSDYKNETLLFLIHYNVHKIKLGTYAVSMKMKNYLQSCEYYNITIQSLLLYSKKTLF